MRVVHLGRSTFHAMIGRGDRSTGIALAGAVCGAAAASEIAEAGRDRHRLFFGKRNDSRTCLVQTFRRAGTNHGRDGLPQVEVEGAHINAARIKRDDSMRREFNQTNSPSQR